MKAYNDIKIRRSEVLQLILLHLLYSHQSSKAVFFKGGTAIRWCYGGTRFSEDLDFVTPLEINQLEELIAAISKQLERESIAHFGPGTVTVSTKPSRANASKVLVTYMPASEREKTTVKVEFERLAQGKIPNTTRMVMGGMPSAARLIAEGEFKVPRSSSVILVETPEEIVSDKIRALLERTYLKGRDLYDLWFLCSVRGYKAVPETVVAKLGMYNALFKAGRTLNFFSKPGDKEIAEIKKSLETDLPRFIGDEALGVLSEGGFNQIIDAVRSVFEGLLTSGIKLS